MYPVLSAMNQMSVYKLLLPLVCASAVAAIFFCDPLFCHGAFFGVAFSPSSKSPAPALRAFINFFSFFISLTHIYIQHIQPHQHLCRHLNEHLYLSTVHAHASTHTTHHPVHRKGILGVLSSRQEHPPLPTHTHILAHAWPFECSMPFQGKLMGYQYNVPGSGG